MIIIPYNTDAPIYHWPYATVATIALNVVIYVSCVVTWQNDVRRFEEMSPEQRAEELGDVGIFAVVDGVPMITALDDIPLYKHVRWQEILDPYTLHYGKIRPWEWITSAYIHADFLHVASNMALLWGLAIIVEGKVGWWRFLLIYNGIGFLQGGLESLIGLSLSGGSLGASAIVFGMVAIALIWAPRNELSCLLFVIRIIFFDISVMMYAAFVIAWEIIIFMLTYSGDSSTIISTPFLHLSGAVVGAGFGFLFLKLHWVDCEGYDLLTVLAGKEGQQRTKRKKKKTTPDQKEKEQRLAALESEIRHMVQQGNPQVAYVGVQKAKSEFPDWQYPAEDFLRLISAYHKQGLYRESVPVMVAYLQQYDAAAPKLRLQLAKILILKEHRPIQALRVLEKIKMDDLDSEMEKLHAALVNKAQAARAEGSMEAAVQDW